MGRLIVDGGDGKKKYANGGAGGIIQIISPVCNLFGGGLSLGHGEDAPDSTDICSAGTTKANGYYYLQGMPIKRSVMRVFLSAVDRSKYL